MASEIKVLSDKIDAQGQRFNALLSVLSKERKAREANDIIINTNFENIDANFKILNAKLDSLKSGLGEVKIGLADVKIGVSDVKLELKKIRLTTNYSEEFENLKFVT